MTSSNVDDPATLTPGTEVEVLTRYQSRWSAGFEIAAVTSDRYLIRRRSDGALLPVTFCADQVRARR